MWKELVLKMAFMLWADQQLHLICFQLGDEQALRKDILEITTQTISKRKWNIWEFLYGTNNSCEIMKSQ